mmetsp:Transcript_9060/g.10487  ORF Transcript_9060/g.10487 Transcript_9060/m.10487 type:complete len:102 (-) Transcript_9060:259-564(-)
MNTSSFLPSLAAILVLIVSICSQNVNAFGARRSYHSYHHNSMRTSSSSSMSSSHDGDEAERILKRAAEIRRHIAYAQLEGKTLTQLRQEAQSNYECRKDSE